MGGEKGAFPESGPRMPVIFVGHGNPMNAIEDNAFSRAWTRAGSELPRPRAILSISAHWESEGSRVTSMERPKTIHDFYGFPEELYRQSYDAPGSPELAGLVGQTAGGGSIAPDRDWGLDHGTWSVLKRMFPKADVPVIQLSLDQAKTPAEHYALARGLRPLRDRGILVLGSGNIVHNLARIDWAGGAYDWAEEFDGIVRRLIDAGDDDALVAYDKLGRTARLSIPTNEHYLPLLYALAARDRGEKTVYFGEGITLGSISMRSLRIG